MGTVADHPPVLLMLAAFSRYPQALTWACEQAVQAWGPVSLTSSSFAFAETDYYERSMGSDLQKIFWAFERPFDPAKLVDLKLATNRWEVEYAESTGFPIARPLNLDPGYLTAAKLVLASTKDHAHRIYLGRGIYAEVTLFYKHRNWQPTQWTFPDYRRADYHEFLTHCRNQLRQRQRAGKN